MRRTAAFVFCDLVDSSSLLARRERSAIEQFERVMQTLATTVELGQGQVVKELGDGLMSAFPSAADAIECACELMRMGRRLSRRVGWPVELRIGASLGEVSDTGDDFFGLPVVEASRLCDLAEPGQVLVAERLTRVASTAMELAAGPTQPCHLKGIPEPLDVQDLIWQEMPDRHPVPPVVVRAESSPLVGRDDQLEALVGHLEEAAAERRRVALLAGEAGIGKTRLAAAAAARVSSAVSGVILHGSCHPSFATPYQPFTESIGAALAGAEESMVSYAVGDDGGDLARILTDLPSRLPSLPTPLDTDPESDRLRLFSAVDATLARLSDMAPVVLMLDDLHWAGPATLALLRYLVHSDRPASVALIATYRDTEITHHHPLRAALADLHRSEVVAFHHLGGIDTGDVARLVESRAVAGLAGAHRPTGTDLLALAGRIRIETGGNPYFVGAVLDAMGEDRSPLTVASEAPIPDSVRDVVLDQLDQLQPGGRRLLEAAAVLGPAFDVEVARVVVGADAASARADLDEVVRRKLVVEATAGRYEFNHALVRSSVYRELDADRRARLHLGAGEVLESEPGTNAGILAHHFLAAGSLAPSSRVADHAARAAQQALDQVAHEEAASLLELAVQVMEADEGRDAIRYCDLLLLQAETQVRSGHVETMRAAARKAAELAQQIGSPRRLARAASWFGGAGVVGERDEEAIAMCHHALDLLGPEDEEDRGLVVSVLTMLGSYAGDTDVAGEASRTAEEVASAAGSEEARLRAQFARHVLLWGSERTREQLALARSLAGSEVVVSRGMTGEVNSHRLALYPAFALGRIDEFLTELAQVERLAEDLRNPFLGGLGKLWRGLHALMEGRFEDFDAGLDETAAAVAGEGNFENAVGAQIYFRWFEKGALAEIVPMIENFAARAPGLVGLKAAQALAYADSGRTEEAREILTTLSQQDFAVVPRDMIRPAALANLIEVAVRLGDAERAMILARLASPYRGQLLALSAAFCAGAADRHLAMAYHLAGRTAEAEGLYQSALELETAIGAVPLAARTRAWYARLLLERGEDGDRDRARELVDQVTEVSGRLGMNLEQVIESAPAPASG